MEDTFTFSTERPKQFGFYYVKWSPEEKPTKVYIRYYPQQNIGSSYAIQEKWTWAVDPTDQEPEDIEVDVTYPELIEFSERVFS